MASFFSLKCSSSSLAICITFILLIQPSTAASSFNVGGRKGWTNVDTNSMTAPDYAAWASTTKFYVGDSLVFKFPAGDHNVWLLPTQTAYDNCDITQAIELDAGATGVYTWKALKEGKYFFTCDKGAEGVGTHCNYGQKLAIAVLSSGSSAPVTSPPAISPTPLTSSPSPHVGIPPVSTPKSSPLLGPSVAKAPVSPVSAPSLSPKMAPTFSPALSSPGPAPSPSFFPPVSTPKSSPLLGPSVAKAPVSPVSAPSLSPKMAPTFPPALSSPGPAPSPSFFPSLSPTASVPTPPVSTPSLSPGTSASTPGQPVVPGGGPTASTAPSPNAGVRLPANEWTSIVTSLALLVLMWW